MNQLPNELNCRVLLFLPYKDIVRARAVCRTWASVIEEFAILQYVVWLGIHGRVAPTSTSSSAAEEPVADRLSKLLREEAAWVDPNFTRTDTLRLDNRRRLELRGSGASHAGVFGPDKSTLLCSLPSGRDDPPPRVMEARPLIGNHIDIDALDHSSNVIITLSSPIGDHLEFSVMALDDPSKFHSQASTGTLTSPDLTRAWADDSFTDIIVDKFVYRAAYNYERTEWLSLIWNWQSGELISRLILEDDDVIGFSEPMFLNERKFMMTYILKHPLPEACIQMYEIDLTNPSREPREIRRFQLPPTTAEFSLADCVSRSMSPTHSGARARSETLTSGSIYADHEQLCHVLLSYYPQGHDRMQQYSFFVYPSTFMSNAYGDKKDVPWDSWGPENASMSESGGEPSPMWAQWYSRGDRVAVVTRKSPVSPTMYNWSLRILDFRPARVRRAHLATRGQKIWPLSIEREGNAFVGVLRDYAGYGAYGEEPVPCNLPCIQATILENIVAANIEVEMDDRRIVLNQESDDSVTFECKILTF